MKGKKEFLTNTVSLRKSNRIKDYFCDNEANTAHKMNFYLEDLIRINVQRVYIRAAGYLTDEDEILGECGKFKRFCTRSLPSAGIVSKFKQLTVSFKVIRKTIGCEDN